MSFNLYRLANSWCVRRIEYLDFKICTISMTLLHLSCCNTNSFSYIPGSCLVFGLMHRIKCAFEFSNCWINLNNCSCNSLSRNFIKTQIQSYFQISHNNIIITLNFTPTLCTCETEAKRLRRLLRDAERSWIISDCKVSRFCSKNPVASYWTCTYM